jgi:hypothetical protein
MCNVSAVFDQYQPVFPETYPYPQHPVPYTNDELRELIESFKQALEAAKKFDRITKQPDCEDPDKAKLLDRVADLERRLDAIEVR